MKILKRKAVFKVTFQIYTTNEEEYKKACDTILHELMGVRDIVDSREDSILSIAQVETIRRMAR